jgi:hypothetical protein
MRHLPAIVAANPHGGPATFPNYAVSHDGRRFLMLKPIEQEQATPSLINLVLTWFEELKSRVPTEASESGMIG